MGLTSILHRMAQRDGQPALIDGADRMSWGEWGEASSRIAGGLRARGIGAGDRVAILARNGIPFCTTLFGIWWAGAVAVPVNLRWSAVEIGQSLADCGSRLLIVAPDFEPLSAPIRAMAASIEEVIVIGDERWWALTDCDAVPDRRRSGSDLAALLYTGGTTGRSKGVMLSHRNMLASALGGLASSDAPPIRRFLHVAPLFHIGALSGLLLTCLSGGANVLLPGFEPGAVLAAIDDERVSDLFFVPTMLQMILDDARFGNHDLSCVRSILYGAAPMDSALLERVMLAFPDAALVQAYGMTELSPIATMLGAADHAAGDPARLRSAGRATAATEVRVVDGDDRELPRGAVGEIVARGDGVMLGYWNQPDATSAALRGGWMHTGDLGRMDDAGYLTVVDRLKDMIVTGGENVYSVEVEDVLAAHPKVGSCAVIGVPDRLWGERVHAVIVPTGDSRPTLAELVAHCRERLAGYKAPRSLELADALPLSAAGKVLKTALRTAATGEGKDQA